MAYSNHAGLFPAKSMLAGQLEMFERNLPKGALQDDKSERSMLDYEERRIRAVLNPIKSSVKVEGLARTAIISVGGVISMLTLNPIPAFCVSTTLGLVVSNAPFNCDNADASKKLAMLIKEISTSRMERLNSRIEKLAHAFLAKKQEVKNLENAAFRCNCLKVAIYRIFYGAEGRKKLEEELKAKIRETNREWEKLYSLQECLLTAKDDYLSSINPNHVRHYVSTEINRVRVKLFTES